MSRSFLTEDLAQIQRYFPGAKPIALKVPFEFTEKPRKVSLSSLDTTENLEYLYGEGLVI